MKLINIQKEVLNILNNYPETRGSDKILYYRFLEEFAPQTLQMAVGSYLVDRHSDVPSIESVGRCRRKLQEKNPELRADKRVTEIRRSKEKEYKEYANG